MVVMVNHGSATGLLLTGGRMVVMVNHGSATGLPLTLGQTIDIGLH